MSDCQCERGIPWGPRVADDVDICFSERATRNRTNDLRTALGEAAWEFERSFGFSYRGDVRVTAGTPAGDAGLQAVDYFLWALQRFYERDEDRFLDVIWPRVGEIHDLDIISHGRRGVFYTQSNRLTPAARAEKQPEDIGPAGTGLRVTRLGAEFCPPAVKSIRFGGRACKGPDKGVQDPRSQGVEGGWWRGGLCSVRAPVRRRESGPHAALLPGVARAADCPDGVWIIIFQGQPPPDSSDTV